MFRLASLAGIAAVFLFSLAALGQDEFSTVFAVTLSADEIALEGTVSSAASKNILLEAAKTQFDDRRVTSALKAQSAMPPGWSLLAEKSMAALATLDEGAVYIDLQTVRFNGKTSDSDKWQTAFDAVLQSLPHGFDVIDGVTPGIAFAEFQAQCQNILASHLRSGSIEFTTSSAELRSPALPVLDGVAQVASDCADASLIVRGHTDSRGDEAFNLYLSRERADAVGDYLVSRGIAAERITTRGVGSSEPLTDERDRRSRARNRRIEILLKF